MKIIGVDPGLARTGWAVIEEINGKLKPLSFGCIETKKDLNESKRLSAIYSNLKGIIKKERPEILAIEKLFFSKNVKTALSVGQARGVALLAGVDSGLIIEEYTPLQVKIAVTGYGRAEKRQVGQMVKKILNLESVPKLDDTADAIAVALTHAVPYKIREIA